MKGKVAIVQNIHNFEPGIGSFPYFTPPYCLSILMMLRSFQPLVGAQYYTHANEFQSETSSLEKDSGFHEVNESDIEDPHECHMKPLTNSDLAEMDQLPLAEEKIDPGNDRIQASKQMIQLSEDYKRSSG